LTSNNHITSGVDHITSGVNHITSGVDRITSGVNHIRSSVDIGTRPSKIGTRVRLGYANQRCRPRRPAGGPIVVPCVGELRAV
jgi:hypothetical protein